VIRRQGCFKPKKNLATGEGYRHLRRSRRNFKDAPNPAAACVALSAIAFANVARADDAPAKPDAMAADHMSGDHMAPMKKPHMKKHMMKEGGHMMAPETPK
jgi:pentapeptide MXKDX repeat protein